MFLKCTGRWGLYYTYYYDAVNNLWVWSSALNTAPFYMSAIIGIPMWVNGAGTKYYPAGFLYNGIDYYYAYGYDAWRYHWMSTRWKADTLLGSTVSPYYGIRNNGADIAAGNMRLDEISTNPVRWTWTIAPIVGYTSNALLGVYTKIGGANTKYIGFRSHNYGTGKNFLEQTTIYNTKSTYLDSSADARVCWWDSTTSTWVISAAEGTKDTLVGYWEKASGTEPTGTYARIFTGEGIAPLPVSYVLAAPTYFEGTDKTTMLMGQVTLWL